MKRDTLARNAPRKNSLSAITARSRDIGPSIAISRRRTMASEEAAITSEEAAAGLGEDRLALEVEEELAMVDGGLVIETITTATPVAMEVGVQHGRITTVEETLVVGAQLTIRSTAMTREPVAGGLRKRMRCRMKEQRPGERRKTTTASRRTTAGSTRAVAAGVTRNQ